MVCGGIARLYLQSPRVVSHCCIIAAQAVVGECSIVESSAMAWIQLNGSAVVPEGFLKSTLYSTTTIVDLQQWACSLFLHLCCMPLSAACKQTPATALPRQQESVVYKPCGLFHLELLSESTQVL